MIIKEFEEEKVINDDIKGKRKINVRFEYLTKMKLYYRKFMAKHYAKKEQKMLEDKNLYANEDAYNMDHQNVIDKMNQQVDKFQEHKEKLAEIEEIKKDRALEKALEKAKDKYSNAMEKLDRMSTDENLNKAKQAEEQLVQLQQAQMPVSEDSQKIIDSVQETLAQNVQDIQTNTPAVEETVPVEPVVETTEAVVQNVPEVQESVVNVVEPVQQKTDVFEENSDVKSLLEQFGQSKVTFDSNWEQAMQAVKNAVKNYNNEIQKNSVEALANKQVELNEQKKANSALTQQNNDLINANNRLSSDLTNSQNEVASLKQTNRDKDAQIQELISENKRKDKQIDDITSLYNDQFTQNKLYQEENAKLRSDVEAMSQQFKRMQEMFNGFQAKMVGTVQQNESSVVEEPVQKVK